MSVPDAILARLRAAVDPVYDGEVPTDPDGQPLVQRYAVFYASPGARAGDNLARVADQYTYRWQVTSVGTSREQAGWVAVRCRDAVLDQRLTVDGWVLNAVEHESSAPIRRDDDLPGESLFAAVDTYSVPATR